MSEHDAAAEWRAPLDYPAAPVRTRRRPAARRLVIPVSPYTDVVVLMPHQVLGADEWAQLVDVLCAMRPSLIEPAELAELDAGQGTGLWPGSN